MLPGLLSRLIRSLPVFLGLLMLLFLTAGRSAAYPGIIAGSSFFQEAAEYSSGAPDAYQVVVADLNGDGIPDAVVTHSCYGCANGTVSVLLGIGGGAAPATV